MKRKKTVQIGDGPGVVERVREVFAAVLGRSDEIDIPADFVHLANDAEGRPLYGYLGWRQNPRQADIDRLTEALRKRYGG